MLAHGVDQDDGLALVLFQFGHAAVQLVGRDVQRVDDVPAGELLGRTDIQDHRLVGIDQRGQLAGRQALAALAQLVQQQQDQQDQQRRDQQVVVGGELDQTGNELHGDGYPGRKNAGQYTDRAGQGGTRRAAPRSAPGNGVAGNFTVRMPVLFCEAGQFRPGHGSGGTEGARIAAFGCGSASSV